MKSRKGVSKNIWRLIVTAAVWLVVGVGMVMLGMEPRLVLLGFVVMVVAASLWLALDLGVAASKLDWHDPRARSGARDGHDLRVQILRSRLRRPTPKRTPARQSRSNDTEPVDEITETLRTVIDDHLIAEHGIDRRTDPEGAAEALGPDLARLVSDPSASKAMTRRRSLAGTIKLIEDFTKNSASTPVATKDSN